jgi:glucose-6-phosphate dehydrogenase assembly protein OpcA
VIRGLIVPDLPVILYCPGGNVFRLSGFDTLLPLAHKLILDSTGMHGSAGVIAYLDELKAKQTLIAADLAWGRLTPWRESIGRIFDEPERRRVASEIREIHIQFNAEEEPSGVYYLAGWLARVLKAPINLSTAAPSARPAVASICSVRLMGGTIEVSAELIDQSTVQVRVNEERDQVTVFPERSEYEALRQELKIVGRDVLFEDVLGLARNFRSRK